MTKSWLVLFVFLSVKPARAQTAAAAGPEVSVSSAPADADASLEGLLIASVAVTGNRTAMAVLEPRITLKRGRPFHQAELERTRRNLYAMRLFKRLEIQAKRNANGGVDVSILAQDGWYAVPLPLVFGGSGGSGAALIVSERNYFRQDESLFATGNTNSVGSGGSLGANYDRWFGIVAYSDAKYTQYGYSDGSFNTENAFEASRSLSNPSQYGTVVSSFDKSQQSQSAVLQYRVSPDWRAGLGFTDSLIGYSQQIGITPGDAGRQNWLEGRLSWSSLVLGGLGDRAFGSGGGGPMGEMFGSMFGMGLADVDQRIHTLPSTRLRLGADATSDVGSSAFGSDFDFTRYTLQGTAQAEFPKRDILSLRVTASKGFDLPFSQGVTTNFALGLRGNYVREFVGDEGMGASLSGSYILHQSRRGVLAIDAFVESATVSGGGFGGGTQSGVGGGFHYAFWRFPLPLGLGYTYSLTDHDGQISFAAGFGFGG